MFDPLVTVKFALPFNEPENVALPLLLLVSVAAELTVKVLELLNAVDPVSVKLPPPRIMFPEALPKLPSAEIERVPAVTVVSPT